MVKQLIVEVKFWAQYKKEYNSVLIALDESFQIRPAATSTPFNFAISIIVSMYDLIFLLFLEI